MLYLNTVISAGVLFLLLFIISTVVFLSLLNFFIGFLSKWKTGLLTARVISTLVSLAIVSAALYVIYLFILKDLN
jgi:hypothetical protein